MRNTQLHLSIELPYQSKNYAPLSQIGIERYDRDKKTYVWQFPVSKLHDVFAVLGRPVRINTEELNLLNDIAKAPGEDVKVKNAYGEGFVEVAFSTKKPGHFVVTTVRHQQPQRTYVTFDIVQALWSVIRVQPLNKKISTSTTAGNFCEKLGIIDFNTYTNRRFNWKYFSGSRKHYLIFYACIKVLVHYGVIEHIAEGSKSGIKRLKESWTIQTGLV